jgi:hypothetical protein
VPLSVSLLTNLQDEIIVRLDEIETERSQLLAAMKALGGSPASSRRPRRVVAARRVLAEVRAVPGVRSSVIAMTLRSSTTSVAAVLEELETRGDVVRSGMGWALRD